MSCCDLILGSIIKRASNGTHYGVVVLAEGLIGAIGEKGLEEAMGRGQLGRYGNVTIDPHGHMRLGEIEFGRMVKDWLAPARPTAQAQDDVHRQGSGLRFALLPIRFRSMRNTRVTWAMGRSSFCARRRRDSLGRSSVLWKGTCSRCRSKDAQSETKRMKTRKVDVSGEGYECARRYMIRLEQRDFDDLWNSTSWPNLSHDGAGVSGAVRLPGRARRVSAAWSGCGADGPLARQRSSRGGRSSDGDLASRHNPTPCGEDHGRRTPIRISLNRAVGQGLRGSRPALNMARFPWARRREYACSKAAGFPNEGRACSSRG